MLPYSWETSAVRGLAATSVKQVFPLRYIWYSMQYSFYCTQQYEPMVFVIYKKIILVQSMIFCQFVLNKVEVKEIKLLMILQFDKG